MLSLKRPLYGIFWFCIFFAVAISVIGTILALYHHINVQDMKAMSVFVSNLLENRINLISLPIFLIVLVLSAKGRLPGTRPASREIENSGAGPLFGFSDALALVVYLVVIQTGLQFLQGSVFETIGMPQIEQTPAAHCMIFGLSSVLLALFALRVFGTSATALLGRFTANYRAFALLAFLIAGNALIESEIGNMQRAYLQYPDYLQKAMEDMLNQGALSVLLVAVIAPLTEEIVFRGVIVKQFLKRFPAPRAIVLSAIVFSFARMDPLQMLSGFGMGILLGWLYYQTGNLWACILVNSSDSLLTYCAYHHRLPINFPGFNAGMAIDKIQFQPVWIDALGIVLLAAGIAAVRVVARRNNGTDLPA